MQAAELEKRINKRKDAIFKDFSKVVGVKNMREHEAKIEAKMRDIEERTSKLRRQLMELHADEDRCRTTLQEHDMKRERMQCAIKVRPALSNVPE
jgi:chromosome condensin MukBEF ATPase and DNA-binding subunit MukB